ncbi:MAG: response regulator [Rhodospirillaceae bacterium]|nr:response regulator [Rhodospirillaceae bacterium]
MQRSLASAGQALLDTFYPETLRRDQLVVLAQTTPINAFVSIVNALIIAAVLWPEGNRLLVLLWAGAACGFSIFQLKRWVRFRGRTLPATVRAGSWRKPVLWATLGGLLWSSALVFVPGAGPAETLTLCVMFAGVAAGGAATLAVLPLAAAGFVIAVLVPVAAFFLFYGDLDYAAVGAFAIMLLLTLLSSALVVFRWFAESREARRRAESANQAKSEFLAVMSHELRTPLASVISGVDLLAATSLTSEQKQFVDQALASSLQLTGLLGDILDISKLEAGQIVLEKIPFDLPDMLRETVATAGARAATKGLSLSLDIGEGAGGWRLGDPTRLRQVLLNLITNSVKFTEHGGIRVSVGPDAEPGLTRFSVADTGIGMAEHLRAHVFEKFTQADQTITRRFGGAGLGLAICKQLVEAMGGGIDFVSEVGRGTTFWFTARLPATEAQATASAGTAQASVTTDRCARILLVEDNDVNRRLIAQLVGGLGFEVELAGGGRSAVEAARARPFDAILMDIQMPDIDGLEATRQIRSEPGPNRETPIIALTGNVFEEDRQSAMAAGFDDYLAKPIRPAALGDALAKHLSGGPRA